MKSSGLFSIMLYFFTLLFVNCNKSGMESASFITTLGNDTLVIEQFTLQPEEIKAQVLIRTPQTQYLEQTLLLNPDGSFREFHSATYDPMNISGEKTEEENITILGDSLVRTNKSDGNERTSAFAYDSSIIPWFDMVHWPYEVATRKMVAAGLESQDQLMLAGRNPAIFEIRSITADSVSIKHPYRGTMFAKIDENGAIQYYDATETTRKLIVRRGGTVDMEALAKKYGGRSIGSLSGKGSSQALVHGSNISFTFGQPARRGRELFGGIVPWNKRWRTGANRATHFKSNKDLIFGKLAVPAGEYTLYTIPAPDGGTLIINKQTGQNGNSYDETQDLGRIPMRLVENEQSVELFVIEAIERSGKGVIQLKWGNTIFEIDFEVTQ